MSQKLALILTTVMSLGVAVPVAAEGLVLGGSVTMPRQLSSRNADYCAEKATT